MTSRTASPAQAEELPDYGPIINVHPSGGRRTSAKLSPLPMIGSRPADASASPRDGSNKGSASHAYVGRVQGLAADSVSPAGKRGREEPPQVYDIGTPGRDGRTKQRTELPLMDVSTSHHRGQVMSSNRGEERNPT